MDTSNTKNTPAYLEDNSSWGGGKILETLVALGPQGYNTLSLLFHAFGLCGPEGGGQA